MKPYLTVIIPCRNEHDTIQAVVYEVYNVMYRNKIPAKVLVIDDYSEPPLTLGSVKAICLQSAPRLYKNVAKPGIAGALKTGITYADSKYVIFMSGDGTDDPEAIPLLYRYLFLNYDCVFYQREWNIPIYIGYNPLKWTLNRLGNRLIGYFFDRSYSDYTYMFKGYRLSVAHMGLLCQSKGFAFPMELCLRAMMSGASYKVLSITPRARIAGQSKFRLYHELPEYLTVLYRCLKLKYGKKE